MVIQTEHLSADAAVWLAERCRLVACRPGSAEFDRAIGEACGMVVRTYTIVDDKLLDRAGNLRVVGRAGVGLDNIDVAACRRRSIEVVYTPDANTQAVVEYVVCLLGDALRPRVSLEHAVDVATWNQLREETVGKRQMNQLTLGILGLGRVGKRLAEVARAIGFQVLYNDVEVMPPEQRFGAEPVDARTLFATADVVSVHVDGRPSNRKFINAELIARMKPQAIFINTSRGLVVDNLALADWLRGNPQSLAMLDVHDPEPIDEKYPLLGVPNARLYPHLASRTETAMNNMSWVVKDVIAVLEGKPPRFAAPQ